MLMKIHPNNPKTLEKLDIHARGRDTDLAGLMWDKIPVTLINAAEGTTLVAVIHIKGEFKYLHLPVEMWRVNVGASCRARTLKGLPSSATLTTFVPEKVVAAGLVAVCFPDGTIGFKDMLLPPDGEVETWLRGSLESLESMEDDPEVSPLRDFDDWFEWLVWYGIPD